MEIEQHRGLIVVAMRAQRAAKPRVLVAMADGAGDVAAVRAAPVFGVAAGAARQHGLAAHAAGVDRAEGGGGEGGEHARVGSDRFGDALATGQARAHQLPGVALIQRRAGGAGGFAAVAAGELVSGERRAASYV